MGEWAIRVAGLRKQYPGRDAPVDAVRGLDLEIPQGECFGLLGPNGAGKTTTVEILEGLTRPTSGDVEVLGRRWESQASEIRERIGVTLQETRFPDKSTLRELVGLFRGFYRDGLEPDDVLATVSLDAKGNSYVEQLSGGQQQRLAVAVALVGDPELLFLDEPTTGLDPQSRRQLWDVILDLHDRGRTTVLTTHYMDEAERLCDRVAIVDHGKVIALGSPANLIARLGGEHIVEFAVLGDGPCPDHAAFAELSTVLGTRAEGDGYALTVGAPHRAIPALLGYLESAGRPLARLTTRQVSLEDVFVALTGRHLREEEPEIAKPTKPGWKRRALNGPSPNRVRPRLGTRRSLPAIWTSVAENFGRMSHYHPLRGLYLSRLREFYRQPARLFWVYGFPTLLALGLGLAFQGRVPDSVQVALVENAASEPVEKALKDYDSKARVEKKQGVLLKVFPEDEAMRRLRTGKTPLVIVPSVSGPIAFRYDPTRPEATSARAAIDAILQREAGRVDPIKTEDAILQEPGSRYIDFLIPGLIGQNTMGGGLWGVGFLIVNFRIGKLLKRFTATPMPRRDFLLAILAARLTFLIPDVAVLLSLGVFKFGMPIRGDLWLIGLVEVVGALAFAGIGLLIASRAQTTETVSGLMNLIMLPMWIFSGLFFSAERFPEAAQPFIQALPLTQLLNALRAIMLEGEGITSRVVLVALAVLSAWAIATFAVALKIFRWQ